MKKYSDLGNGSFLDYVVCGEEVDEQIYNNFLNILPPIGLKGGQGFSAGFQVSEPYCHREDKNGKWRAKYMTFIKKNNKYYYMGLNFQGEINCSNCCKYNCNDCIMNDNCSNKNKICDYLLNN